MPAATSSTGLVSARVRPIYRPRQKRVELFGSTKPAPLALRPFAGLFNPYPYGCSVLCNHPADCEAKEVVRRAKESWATEGKALLLPAEVEMIRATLLAGGGGGRRGGAEAECREMDESVSGHDAGCAGVDGTTVPEELFRKYTETDSRPLTPAPTLASGPPLNSRAVPDLLTACKPRERTTLILDLRTDSQDQEPETLSWHALSLEPLRPSTRNREVSIAKSAASKQPPSSTAPASPLSSTPVMQAAPPPPPPLPPISSPVPPFPPTVEISDASSSKNTGADGDSTGDEQPMRRRGKLLRKRKCRRGSTYGLQTEVRDPPEPLETQVSQITDNSQRDSAQGYIGDAGASTPSREKSSSSPTSRLPISTPSFIDADILKHLGRQLDHETVEEEFSTKRRIALEEALRVKNGLQPGLRIPRRVATLSPPRNVPRVFSRQSARFEILDSHSLLDMKPLHYLARHVFVTSGRKLIFARAFSRYFEETLESGRRILPKDIDAALEEVMGKPLNEEGEARFRSIVGEIKEPLDFRSWCGICAAVERLLFPLPPKEVDPPGWIERADFEGLERRLRTVDIDPQLALLLREIRDR